MIIKGDKKVIKGWVMYDWANSVYSLVISSAIFPIFYEAQTTTAYSEKVGLSSDQFEASFRSLHRCPEAKTQFTELFNGSVNRFLVHFGHIFRKCKA